MSELIPRGPDFQALFTGFAHTAYRLEVRERYNAPGEAEGLRKFVDGERDLDYEQQDIRTWLHMIRELTAAGKVFRRVRVVGSPLTDYSRYGLWSSQTNNAAGEDIRYLARAAARPLGLPDQDYWLFDSTRLYRMHFDLDDRPRGVTLVTDPGEVVRHNHWRDVAWHHAVTREDFAAEQDVA